MSVGSLRARRGTDEGLGWQAVLHYGEAIKAIMNEELGDGIMSAIDMFATIEKIKGKTGEDRLVITLNGKVSSSCSQSDTMSEQINFTARKMEDLRTQSSVNKTTSGHSVNQTSYKINTRMWAQLCCSLEATHTCKGNRTMLTQPA